MRVNIMAASVPEAPLPGEGRGVGVRGGGLNLDTNI